MKSWEPLNIQELEWGIRAGNPHCTHLLELQLESWDTHMEDEVQVYIFHNESCLLFEPIYLLILNRSKTVRSFKKNLYEGQEAKIRTRHGTTDRSKLGKEYVKAVYCHPACLTYKQSISCEMLGWMKYKLESRLQGEISTTLDMQMIPPLWQKVKRN